MLKTSCFCLCLAGTWLAASAASALPALNRTVAAAPPAPTITRVLRHCKSKHTRCYAYRHHF